MMFGKRACLLHIAVLSKPGLKLSRHITSEGNQDNGSEGTQGVWKNAEFTHCLKGAKTIEEIPGPLLVPILGTAYKYIPFIGEYSLGNLHKNSVKRYEKYGPIVRESIAGANVVSVYDPDDIETVFRHSGRFPERSSHRAVELYRGNRPQRYNSGGLLPTNGEEWFKIRSLFQNPISNPANLRGYIDCTASVVDKFCNTIKETYSAPHIDGMCRKDDVPDFLNYLSRLSLELLCVNAFGVKFDTCSEKELLPDSLSTKLIHSTYTVNDCVLPIQFMEQILDYYKPPVYLKAVECLQFIEGVCETFISEKKLQMKGEGDNSGSTPSLLEQYLSKQISEKDILGMLGDLFLGGIDTTSYSTSFILYHLARNQEVQEKLFEETLTLLPDPQDSITSDILRRASYLKACIKESLRLNPISVGIGRLVNQDIVLSGYHIPPGTIVVTNNHVSCTLVQYFKEPHRFLPERWQRSSDHYTRTHPFLYLPFGHGPRTCIAKKMAEQNMNITILKLIRNFQFGWNGGPLGITTTIINKPDGPLSLTVQPRNV